jgi:hypothetical protein
MPEPLPDLPVEELNVAAAPAAAPAKPPAAPGSAASTTPAAATGGANEPEQAGLDFADPEMYLAAGQQPSAVPVTSSASLGDIPGHELELEDPVVDDLLTTPAPPPPAAAGTRTPTAAAPAPAEATPRADRPAASDVAPRPTARVPIARTVSLAAAASKIAAASTVREQRASAAQISSVPRPVTANVRPAAGPGADAQSLASWANARAAAAPPKMTVVPTASAAPRTPAAAPAAASAPAPAAAATAPAVAPAPVPAAPAMDRDFIARNQVVERYLSGRLPLKGATDFERFCHDHPELLDEIGLPERVNAGLRLLEASGKPEPWQESARPVWQKPQFTLALAAAGAVFAVALAVVASGSAGKSRRIAELQKQATERALDPATSRREIRLLPSRAGASNSPAITIGGSSGGAQLVDLKIDESRSPAHTFRVTIDRIDQGRVAVINNLGKDSNGHLRIALNSSALGPGNYQLTLEGLDWRGEPQPDSWITIGIQR